MAVVAEGVMQGEQVGGDAWLRGDVWLWDMILNLIVVGVSDGGSIVISWKFERTTVCKDFFQGLNEYPPLSYYAVVVLDL